MASNNFSLWLVEVVGWCSDVVCNCLLLHRLWGFQGGAGQSQPPPVFCLGPLGISYNEICRRLLLVPGLEPFSRRYRGWVQLLLV